MKIDKLVDIYYEISIINIPLQEAQPLLVFHRPPSRITVVLMDFTVHPLKNPLKTLQNGVMGRLEDSKRIYYLLCFLLFVFIFYYLIRNHCRTPIPSRTPQSPAAGAPSKRLPLPSCARPCSEQLTKCYFLSNSSGAFLFVPSFRILQDNTST